MEKTMYKIIIGLGNPGEKYKLSRHNAGFMAVDALASKYNLDWQNNKKFNAEITRPYSIEGKEEKKLIFIKPKTYMNNSGQTVQAVLSYYKLLPKKFGLIQKGNSDLSQLLTVIHDDLDIKIGQYKIAINSSSAGHKGVQSIINHLKTKNFKRIRIGIGAESNLKIPAEKFVLGNFNKDELEIINGLISKIYSDENPL